MACDEKRSFTYAITENNISTHFLEFGTGNNTGGQLTVSSIDAVTVRRL